MQMTFLTPEQVASYSFEAHHILSQVHAAQPPYLHSPLKSANPTSFTLQTLNGLSPLRLMSLCLMLLRLTKCTNVSLCLNVEKVSFNDVVGEYACR